MGPCYRPARHLPEQTSGSRQSRTGVSAPYRAAISVRRDLGNLAQRYQPDLGRRCVVERQWGGGLGLHLTMPPVFGSRQRCRCIFAASDPIGQSTMASRAAADAENDILTFLRNDLIAVDRSITLSTSAAGRQAGRPSGAALRRGRYRRIAAHGLASGTPRRRTAHALALFLLATARGQRIPPSVNQEDEGVTPPVRTRPGSLNEH